MKKYDFMVVAGGTGGHIFPALALICELTTEKYRVCWAGQDNSIEQKLAQQHDIDFIITDSPMWSTNGIKGKFITIYRLLIAVLKSWRILKNINPQTVIGFGSYVSVSIGLCAVLQRRKLLIHEQNIMAGKANKLLSFFAHKVMLGFPHCIGIKKNTYYTGNPIRKNLVTQNMTKEKKLSSPFKILVLGGSNGSHSLNILVANAISNISGDIEVWHQAGMNNIDKTQDIYDQNGKDSCVVGFIDDMREAYAWASIIITRAGALSIAESIANAIPTILVPNPKCAGNHQLYNAEYVAKNGAGICIIENHAAEKNIEENILSMLAVPAQYEKMKKSCIALANIDSVKNIVKVCKLVITKC